MNIVRELARFNLVYRVFNVPRFKGLEYHTRFIFTRTRWVELGIPEKVLSSAALLFLSGVKCVFEVTSIIQAHGSFMMNSVHREYREKREKWSGGKVYGCEFWLASHHIFKRCVYTHKVVKMYIKTFQFIRTEFSRFIKK